MLHKLRPAFVITEREVRDQLRDWRIIFPVLGLTIFFPFLMNFTAQRMLNFVNQYGAGIVGERLVPFLLMVVGFFPISVSLVIALETFVGEKERGSIEPLLNTPLEDWQLYLGKLLAATVTPLLASYTGMAVYMIGLAVDKVPLPEFWMIVQIIALTTVQAVMMVSGAVVVSTQATSVKASNLLASFIVIPAALLIQGESVMMFWGTNQVLWWAIIGLMLLTLLFMRIGLAHFRREELLGRQLDVINLRWGWQVFWQSFTGGANSFKEWYLVSIPHTIRHMRISVLIVTGLTVCGVLIGVGQVNRFQLPIDETMIDSMGSRLQDLLTLWPMFSIGPVLAIWWQNVRVMLLAMAVGVFSMGILGTLPLIASMGVAGYLLGIMDLYGLSLSTYLGFVVPHGIFEIPAAILATAAVFQFGVILATPTSDKTVGEVWLNALADWTKIMVGVVIPALFLAAGIEAWLTPRLVMMILK